METNERFTAVAEEELAGVAGGDLYDGWVPDPSYATDPNQDPTRWSPLPGGGWDSYPDQDDLEQGGYQVG
jgi:hypothetical protein